MSNQLQEQHTQLGVIPRQSASELLSLAEHLITFSSSIHQKQSKEELLDLRLSQYTADLRNFVLHQEDDIVIPILPVLGLMHVLTRMLLYKLAFLLKHHIEDEELEPQLTPDAVPNEPLPKYILDRAVSFLQDRDSALFLSRSVKSMVIPDAAPYPPSVLPSLIVAKSNDTQEALPLTVAKDVNREVLVERCVQELHSFFKKNHVYSFSTFLQKRVPAGNKRKICVNFFSILLMCTNQQVSIQQETPWQDFTFVYSP